MSEKIVAGKTIPQWIESVPILEKIVNTEELFWINQHKTEFKVANKRVEYTQRDVDDAESRLKRFASYIKTAFPETEKANGIIESELTPLIEMKKIIEKESGTSIQGNFLLKRDDTLPIAGTIKARGAIYEVLKHAETLALEYGLLTSMDEDYSIFASEKFHDFFAKHKIAVGTTGNLGISVGTVGAKLGFEVTVHMSVEAKKWKKDFLRSRGVTVIEHESDFTKAVEQGRAESNADPLSYFVDDEHSVDLFLGYTVAGSRLKNQLDAKGIRVDKDHPLFVYLPCGIGGSPGGITFGLKQIYGDNVHCFFAEPTHTPSMLVGLVTQQYDNVSVKDFSIDGKTCADGLAVPRTSGFVAKVMENFFSGSYTLDDRHTYQLLASIADSEQIFLEPAAVAGLPGAALLLSTTEGKHYLTENDLTDKMTRATHIAWATGGSMVPDIDREEFYLQGTTPLDYMQ
ncbi:MAG: D-serine ammonia-lyase [Desemzia incerta]|uniref:D-serine ammonia-lyase n=1 Tax=Desemzia incerta TaxID=82801 RepID=UPI0033163C09